MDFEKLKTIENIKDEFIQFLSKNTQSSDVTEYLNDILDYFKDDLISKIDAEGFDNAIANARRKEIYPFVEEYPSFAYEFFDIIPNDMDKHEFNLII